MNKREKRFWKKQLQISPEEFKAKIGNRLALNHWSIPVTDEVISWMVPYLEDVEELNLTFTDITDEGIAQLGSLKKVNYLRLKDTFLSKDCIPHLIKMKSLEHIHLGIFEGNCSDLIPLGRLKQLKELIVKPRDIDHKALKEIIHQNPNLKLIVNSEQFFV